MEFGRFMACVPLPVFNPRTGDVDHGVCCKGCQVAVEQRDYDFDMEGELPNDNDMFIRMRDLVYSKQGYLQHFVNCRVAKVIWYRSKGGYRQGRRARLYGARRRIHGWCKGLEHCLYPLRVGIIKYEFGNLVQVQGAVSRWHPAF